MLYSCAARLTALLLLCLVLLLERARALLAAAVRPRGVQRYVVRGGRLVRVASVPDGELCACDVPVPGGDVLRTLARGMAAVDVEAHAAARKRVACSVAALEPAAAPGCPAAAVRAAREFLMERCGGWDASTRVAEVVRLMAAAARAGPSGFADRLTVVTADFETAELAGDDAVAICQSPPAQ